MISLMLGARQQVLERAEAEDDVLEVLLERAEDQVLAQLAVQVGTDEREGVGVAFLDAVDAAVGVVFRGEVELAPQVVQQGVQFGLALGDEGGGHVELVAGEHGEVGRGLPIGLHDELMNEQIAEGDAGDLGQQSFVAVLKDGELAADVVDVVFEQQDALAKRLPLVFDLGCAIAPSGGCAERRTSP